MTHVPFCGFIILWMAAAFVAPTLPQMLPTIASMPTNVEVPAHEGVAVPSGGAGGTMDGHHGGATAPQTTAVTLAEVSAP